MIFKLRFRKATMSRIMRQINLSYFEFFTLIGLRGLRGIKSKNGVSSIERHDMNTAFPKGANYYTKI